MQEWWLCNLSLVAFCAFLNVELKVDVSASAQNKKGELCPSIPQTLYMEVMTDDVNICDADRFWETAYRDLQTQDTPNLCPTGTAVWIFHTTYTAERKMRIRMGTYSFLLGTEQATFCGNYTNNMYLKF